jgi:hypothetical protein
VRLFTANSYNKDLQSLARVPVFPSLSSIFVTDLAQQFSLSVVGLVVRLRVAGRRQFRISKLDVKKALASNPSN